MTFRRRYLVISLGFLAAFLVISSAITYKILEETIVSEHRKNQNFEIKALRDQLTMVIQQVEEAANLCTLNLEALDQRMPGAPSWHRAVERKRLLQQILSRYEILGNLDLYQADQSLISVTQTGLEGDSPTFVQAVLDANLGSGDSRPTSPRLVRNPRPGVEELLFLDAFSSSSGDGGWLVLGTRPSLLSGIRPQNGLKAWIRSGPLLFPLFGAPTAPPEPEATLAAFDLNRGKSQRLLVQTDEADIQGILGRFAVLMLLVDALSFLGAVFLARRLSRQLTRALETLEDEVSRRVDLPSPPQGPPLAIRPSRFSLRTRSFAYFFLICLVPLVIGQGFAFLYARTILDTRYRNTAVDQLQRLSTLVATSLQALTASLESLSTAEQLQVQLEGPQPLTLTRGLLETLTSRSTIQNIRILDAQGREVYNRQPGRPGDEDRLQTQLATLRGQVMVKTWDLPEVAPPDRPALRVGMEIRSITEFSRLGFLFVDFDSSVLTNAIANSFPEGNEAIYLVGDQGRYLDGSTVRGLLVEDPAALIRTITESQVVPGPLIRETGQYLLLTQPIEPSGWSVCLVLGKQAYQASRANLTNLNLLPALIFLVVLVILVYELSQRMTEKIATLSAVVAQTYAQGLPALPLPPGNDEVARLASGFQDLLDRVRALNQAQLRFKDAELKALQSQIDPHFLYNTLDTLDSLVLTQDARASTLVHQLADLFRLGASQGGRFVRVTAEIQHVSLYLNILGLRFPRKFRVEWQVPPEVEGLYCLKFILQPIVENAINHGLAEVDEGGQILLGFQLVGDELHIEVADNGRGIPPTQLTRLQNQLDDLEELTSVGIFNVHNRLRLCFGDASGLRLASPPGGGTRVTVVQPRLVNLPKAL